MKILYPRNSLQRPSYITLWDIDDEYICDSERDECKVNFDLRNSFIGEYYTGDYECSIDFWFDIITGQENRCNPNTVVFPTGEFQLVFRIYDEDDESHFKEKIIFISNPEKVEIEENKNSSSYSSWGSNIELEDIDPDIYISKPRIIIQSGLSWWWKYMYCEKSECKINLEYEKKHADERCYWDFNDSMTSSSTTHTRCNPWYVMLSRWIHEFSLRVYEKDNDDNKKITWFYVYNNSENQILEESSDSILSQETISKDTSGELSISEKTEELEDIFLGIKLQWKISENKIIEENTLKCMGVDRCYVNFTGITDSESANTLYYWHIDNELFSTSLNPSWIWLEWYGEHKINFLVKENEKIFSQEFTVYVEQESIESSNKIETENLDKGGLSKKDFTQNFLVLKYDWLRVSGKAPAWSKIEIMFWENILSQDVWDNWKYRIVTKNIFSWEHNFDTKLILKNGDEIFLENSWTTQITREQRNLWFQAKKTSSNKQTQQKNWKISISAFNSINKQSTDLGMSLKESVLWIWSIIIIFIFTSLHLLFRHLRFPVAESLNIYKTLFSVKQKVCLLVG